MIAVLGPGAVGGMLAARTGALCVGSPRTVAAIRSGGLRLTCAGVTTTTRADAVERLELPVDLLVVAVKAHGLDDAVERVAPGALDGAVVLPLLNGLEHVARLRELLAGSGAAVVAGSIGRYQAYLAERGAVVQLSAGALVTAASDSLPGGALETALSALRVPAVDVAVARSEAQVLWDKAVRLAVLAAATTAARSPVGVIRSDPAWRTRARAALAEACAAARAEGIAIDPEEHWAFVESLEPQLTTSAARDAAAGRPTELDAITGSVIRAARRSGVPVPELERLAVDAGWRA